MAGDDSRPTTQLDPGKLPAYWAWGKSKAPKDQSPYRFLTKGGVAHKVINIETGERWEIVNGDEPTGSIDPADAQELREAGRLTHVGYVQNRGHRVETVRIRGSPPVWRVEPLDPAEGPPDASGPSDQASNRSQQGSSAQASTRDSPAGDGREPP